MQVLLLVDADICGKVFVYKNLENIAWYIPGGAGACEIFDHSPLAFRPSTQLDLITCTVGSIPTRHDAYKHRKFDVLKICFNFPGDCDVVL